MGVSEELKSRTKRSAVDIVRAVENLPGRGVSEIIRKQVFRSATSIGANYYSACGARSKIDFLSKIRVALEEADETQYWLELLVSLELLEQKFFQRLHGEANELISIFTASAKTVERHPEPQRVVARLG